MDIDMAKKTEQISVRMPPDVFDGLQKIKDAHGLEPAEVLRRCAEAVVQFHSERGYFALPVRIIPDAAFLAAVKETPAANYRPGAPASQTPAKKKSA
jgi:hypothetical protein